MGAEILCPLGCRVLLAPGHFFALISRKIDGQKSKGFVVSASSLTEALLLIEAGKVEVSQVTGCDFQRLRDLPLFVDVVTRPHLVAQKADEKRVYVKRYESPAREPRIKVAVVYPVGMLLKPASFHTTGLNVAWLVKNAPHVLWKKKEG